MHGPLPPWLRACLHLAGNRPAVATWSVQLPKRRRKAAKTAKVVEVNKNQIRTYMMHGQSALPYTESSQYVFFNNNAGVLTSETY